MSLEQAKKFIKRMKTEEAFRSNIMAVEDVADRQKLAKAEGYEFTEEEIKSVSAELIDAAMNSVSAGGNMPIRE
jgi:predicted ribosomally synthesized peptide with nif11-like leader